MSMLQTGVAWLQGQRKQSLSQPGMYQRGAAQIPNLMATPGETVFTLATEETIRLAENQVDWIVTASDLVIDGAVTLPQTGDSYTTGGMTYEVMQPDGVSQPYRLDPTGQQLRIFTKRIV